MKVTASVQVLPLQSVDSVEKAVDRVVNLLESKGLRYEVNAHSTVLEGDFEDVVEVFREIGRICEETCLRCVFSVQVDVKRGGVGIEDKVGKYRRGG